VWDQTFSSRMVCRLLKATWNTE